MWQIILPPINLHSIGQRKHMISEVDLRDWHQVDWSIKDAEEPDPIMIREFYNQVRAVYLKQMRIIPAILRKDDV